MRVVGVGGLLSKEFSKEQAKTRLGDPRAQCFIWLSLAGGVDSVAGVTTSCPNYSGSCDHAVALSRVPECPYKTLSDIRYASSVVVLCRGRFVSPSLRLLFSPSPCGWAASLVPALLFLGLLASR